MELTVHAWFLVEEYTHRLLCYAVLYTLTDKVCDSSRPNLKEDPN